MACPPLMFCTGEMSMCNCGVRACTYCYICIFVVCWLIVWILDVCGEILVCWVCTFCDRSEAYVCIHVCTCVFSKLSRLLCEVRMFGRHEYVYSRGVEFGWLLCWAPQISGSTALADTREVETCASEGEVRLCVTQLNMGVVLADMRGRRSSHFFAFWGIAAG